MVRRRSQPSVGNQKINSRPGFAPQLRALTGLTGDFSVQPCLRLASNEPSSATGNLFADILKTPAVQALVQRVEPGGVLTFSGIATAAQPFFAALLQRKFPNRSIVLVTENLKAQESCQQDLETWLGEMRSAERGVRSETPPLKPDAIPGPLFFPAWEILPHEGKLPPADVISDRLQTLVALGASRITPHSSCLVVTSVVALLQKTFAAADLKNRTRHLNRGDQIAPLDLIEWLEEQGYEPEAQVTQRGEIALRGGIVDIYPPTSP